MIKIFALIAVSIGDRTGENRVIRFCSILEEYDQIDLGHSIEYNPEAESYLGAMKNKQSERIVDVSKKLIVEINKYKQFLKDHLKYEISDEDPLFYNYQLQWPYSDTYLRQIFYHYIDLADVPKIRLYDLRHTFATDKMADGWELYHISDIMGHKNYNTTVKTYGNITKQVRKEIAKSSDKYY